MRTEMEQTAVYFLRLARQEDDPVSDDPIDADTRIEAAKIAIQLMDRLQASGPFARMEMAS